MDKMNKRMAAAEVIVKMQQQGHVFSKEQLGNIGGWIDNHEQLHRNMMDLVKHHKKYPPKRTENGLVIQDILYVDMVGIIGSFMKCFPDFDPDKYESTDEHGERIRGRCRDCAYLRDDWICDDCGKSVYDIADDECSANEHKCFPEENSNDNT